MHNHRIQKWIKGATFGITIAGGNDYGSDANQLNEPGKIAVDAWNSAASKSPLAKEALESNLSYMKRIGLL